MSDDVAMVTYRLCLRALLVSLVGSTSMGVVGGRYVVILGLVDCQFLVAFSCDICWCLVILGGVW